MGVSVAAAGPVDMTITFWFYTVEAGAIVARLPPTDETAPLRARLMSAEANAEGAGSGTFALTLSPLEQGMIMGALGPASCQFSCSLRGAFQKAMLAKVAAIGADLGR